MADTLPGVKDIEWADDSSVCAWSEVESKANRKLHRLGVARLNEQDAFLLYLCIIKLYEEGVKPTYAEIHFKLKEAHASDEVLDQFLIYYLIQSDWYTVRVGNHQLSADIDINFRKLIGIRDKNKCDLRGRQRKQYLRLYGGSMADTVVLLKRTPGWWEGWVNFQDTHNCFSPQVWKEFADFFFSATSDESLSDNKLGSNLFTNTRYALAKILKDLGPDFIQTMRLGDIALLIQLAIQNGFLCYESTTIVPSWTSYTLASLRKFELRSEAPDMTVADKEVLAAHTSRSLADLPQQLSSLISTRKNPKKEDTNSISALSTSDGQASSYISDGTVTPTSSSVYELDGGPDNEVLEVTSIPQLRDLLRNLLETEELVLLSQLRVLLQTKLNITLTPSRFGYIKLSDLLVEHASDICVLIRNQSRHVYIKRAIHSSRVISASREEPKKANYPKAADIFLSTIADIWNLSPTHEVDWNLDRLKELDSFVQERQLLFPVGRKLLFPI